MKGHRTGSRIPRVGNHHHHQPNSVRRSEAQYQDRGPKHGYVDLLAGRRHVQPLTINIPNLRQDSTRSFGFNVSSLDKDASIQQGSFDCIRQTPGSGGGGGGGPGRGTLDNLGALLHKMHIHANEDSYEKTRERMATAEQESKKNCAKVIKITGNDKSAVGRRVKLKRPPGSIVQPPAPTSPPFRPAPSRDGLTSSARPTDRLDTNAMPGGPTSRLERSEQRMERLVEGSMPTLPVTSGQTPHERTSAFASSSANNNNNNNNNSTNNNNNNNVSVSGKNHSPAQANKANRFNNDIMKRSYRERLIHMLAVRPLKKPEILTRLMKEGVKESEKKGMTALLSQITTLRDNTFHLLRNAWHEVHEDDWPFYTPEERIIIKKNRASIEREDSLPRHSATHRVSPQLSGPLTPSNPSSVVSSDSGVHSNHSPSSHSEEATTPNHPNGGAMHGYGGLSQTAAGRDREADRERREHRERDFDRREREREQPGTLDSGPESKRARLAPYGNGAGQSKKSPPISPPLAPSSSRNAPWLTMGSTGSSYCQSSPECVSPSSQDYKSTGSSPAGDVPEYVARYVEITNPEQRFRYKNDFSAEYPRYRQLHHVLDQVSRKFVELESSLRKCDYGSDEFRRVASEIMAEYRKSKNDQEYQSAKKHFQYLHDKLGHIKQLVADFDRVRS
ncbi:RNA polymerase II elongation factor ELL2-like [Tropilaelaps mercedesae]|uniref:RNA polymerase II elongation factor ELL2-like n=1 Tax=Tropilaelaps mercedesae TaxID=418985 RepID=A0A1V9XMF7_9ACAR|nr:RNA polymerase II elongation factor ELL2-like [Tropilaelaps mercedesae]